ncbi:hypothetical protein BKA69DRAFT_1038505 [Paraphysoderma sedebokerense]|nr:hypothetical protein BKA69DRAFT_1038505 [Paraphysoderma sedebokerense]
MGFPNNGQPIGPYQIRNMVGKVVQSLPPANPASPLKPALHLPPPPCPLDRNTPLSELTTVRIGCVPEHFSVPLYLAIQNSVFVNHGLNVDLVWCPGGTGEMLRKLKLQELDVAMTLTEGAVNTLLHGDQSFRILGTYTRSPLIWSIAIHPNSPISNVAGLESRNCGISRFNSGSHIISYLLALNQNFIKSTPSNDLDPQAAEPPFKFSTLNNITNMIKSIHAGETDFFLWEYYTTKPQFDNNQLKRLSNITPPWSAFSIVMSTSFESRISNGTKNSSVPISKLLIESFNSSIAQWNLLPFERKVQNICKLLPNYDEKDVSDWLNNVEFYDNVGAVRQTEINMVAKVLKEAGVWNGRPDGKEGIDVEGMCVEGVQVQ